MDSFFGIGLFELILIAIIALVVLGPERLPGAMREVAKYMRQLRQIYGEFQSQFSEELQLLDEINPKNIINDAMKPPPAKPAPAKPAPPPVRKPLTPATPAATTPAAATPAAATPAAPQASAPAQAEPAILPPSRASGQPDGAGQNGASAPAPASGAAQPDTPAAAPAVETAP